MKDYSQNGEQAIILNYFNGLTGSLLDVGANDGQTLSNSRALIELGWYGDLVEPSPSAYDKLVKLYETNENVNLYNFAIGTTTGRANLYESGTHLKKEDVALLSSLIEAETKRWSVEEFKPVEVDVYTIADSPISGKSYDFITIDTEGMDYDILTQINLTDTKMVCVEFNGKDSRKFVDYCLSFGRFRFRRVGAENLIFYR